MHSVLQTLGASMRKFETIYEVNQLSAQTSTGEQVPAVSKRKLVGKVDHTQPHSSNESDRTLSNNFDSKLIPEIDSDGFVLASENSNSLS